MFPIFFDSLANSEYLYFLHFTSVLISVQQGQQSPQFGKFFFFVEFDRLAEIRASENPREVCESHF